MTLLIQCGTVIDGTGAEPQHNITLTVEAGCITRIATDAAFPRGADILDASAFTVIPCLIDAHVHLTEPTSQPARNFLEERLMTPYSLSIATALANARLLLESGFTSARDAGLTPRGVRMAIDQGLFPGPRLRVAVSPLSQTGGHYDFCFPNGADLMLDLLERPKAIADGVDAVRRMTRTVLRAGADQVKLCTTGGVFSPNGQPDQPCFTPEEIAAVDMRPAPQANR